MNLNAANERMIDGGRAITHLREADETMARIIEAVGPFTLQREAQGFTTLVDAIVSQQISVKAAAAIMGRLAAAVEEMTPEALLALSVETLRSLGLSNQKARYVHDLAAHVADGRVDMAHLESLDDEAIIAQLVQVKGIGRWTAEMYLIFALGRPDVLPVDDLGLRQGVQRAYGLGNDLKGKPLINAMRAVAEPWRPFRSVATWYIWRSLGNAPVLAPQEVEQ